MALAFDRHWQAELSGLVVTATGHGAALPAHRGARGDASDPVGRGQQAAERILQRVAGLTGA